MKNNFLQEILISGILIILLVIFLNPLGFWMPTTLLMMMVLGLVLIFALFSSFIWKENHRDEREGFHKMNIFTTKLGLIILGGIILISGGVVAYKNIDFPQIGNQQKVLSNTEIVAKVKPATVYIETTEGSGSGMIIDAEGYILVYKKLVPTGAYGAHHLSGVKPFLEVTKQQVMGSYGLKVLYFSAENAIS